MVLATAGGLAAERRFSAGAQRISRQSMALLLYAVMPAVAFFNIARLEITVDVGAGLVLGWLALGGAALLGYVLATRVLRLSRPATGVLVNTAMHGNTAYLGLPLCVALLGSEHLSEAVAYDVLVQLPIFLIGVAGVGATFGTAGGAGWNERLRAFFLRNPPLWGTVAGLLAPAALAPDLLVDATRLLVLAMLPVGFFAVGVTMGAESEQGSHPAGAALRCTRSGGHRAATGGRAPAAAGPRGAADRASARLSPAGGHAGRHQRAGHRPRLRARHGLRLRGDRLDHRGGARGRPRRRDPPVSA